MCATLVKVGVGTDCRCEEVADAMIELIEDDKYNGAAMIVSREKGRSLAEFPHTPVQ